MQTNIQFTQTAESEQQKAARALGAFPAEEKNPDAMTASDEAAQAAARKLLPRAFPEQAISLSQSDTRRFRDTPVDNYLVGRDFIANANERPTLFQSTLGRVAGRMVSRGIFGAIAFTWAQNYAGRSMRNYHPDSIQSFGEWGRALVNVRSAAPERHVNKPNTMQAIAKMFDVVAGEPIKWIAYHAAPEGQKEAWAKKSVLFRQRTMHRDPVSTRKHNYDFHINEYGRSLGAEIVGVTADFAGASFGDSLARNVIDTLDPNNKAARKAWRDENGNFSLTNFGADWGKRLWRIVSFNQGEDWAAALPYVYFIKWHRNVIDKFSPGFKLASDNPSWQASSDKLIAEYGKDGEIVNLKRVGDFQKEGAWDLQARFTMYNVFTLMYRNAYTHVGNALSEWWKGDHWLPQVSLPDNPLMAAVEGAGNLARYGAKSFIKANLYMQPAVPTFWMFRTAQSKWQATPIVINAPHPNPSSDKPGATRATILTKLPDTREGIHGDMMDDHWHPNYKQKVAEYRSIQMPLDAKGEPLKHVGKSFTADGSRLHFVLDYDPKYHPQGVTGYYGPLYVGSQQVPNTHYQGNTQLYSDSRNSNAFTAITGPLGKGSFKAGSFFNNMVYNSSDWVKRSVDRMLGLQPVTHHADPARNRRDENWNREKAIRTAVDASVSYTPYMITKAETALRWDNPDMDRAAYRLIDGVTSLDVSEVKKAIAEIGDLLVHPRVRDENTPDANVQPIDASLKPGTKIAAGNVSRAALVHPAHRTLQ